MGTPNSQTLEPLDFASLVARGAVVSGIPAVSYSCRIRLANGRTITLKSDEPVSGEPTTGKEFTPAIREKAAEVLTYISGQARPVKRKFIEREFQNGARGGQLDAVLAFLKHERSIVSDNKGYYTDDRSKFDDE